jgi:hypothetical protein
VEVTLSVLLAGAFSYTVSSAAEPFREWLELGVVIVLTGAVAFIATLLHALGVWSIRVRWLVTAAGAIAATLYGAVVLDLRLAGEAWRAAALVAASALIVLATPALASFGRAGAGVNATEQFRRVTGRLLLRTMAVLLYAAALYAGLALALGAVNTLFELRLDARIYAHTLGWVFFVLVTWVIIGGLPDYVRSDGDAGPVAAAVHRISAFLVTPLLAIYYLILYAYAVRIALTGELPKNLVSPLVIAAGLIAGIALVLFERATGPAAGAAYGGTVDGGAVDRPSAGAGSFRSLRVAAPLFVPLCILGIWGVSMRLGQYGWTEFRGLRMLLLITLGVLALAAVVRVIRRGSLPVYVLPLALAGVSVFSAVGPWSVMAVSRRSQQARLAGAMSAAGIEWNATAVRDTIIPNEPFREMTETVRYLTTHFGADALPPLFAQHAERSGRHGDVVYAAGLRAAQPEPSGWRGMSGTLAHGVILMEDDAETLYYVRIAATPRRSSLADTSTIVPADSVTVRLIVGGMVLFADLAPLGRALLNTLGAPLPLETASVPLHDESGRGRGELTVMEIHMGGEHVLQVDELVGIARIRSQ